MRTSFMRAGLLPDTSWTRVHVDGRPKMLESALAAALAVAENREPGVEISDLTWRAA